MKFKVNVSRDDYGYIIVTAKNEDEARDIVETGDWQDDELMLKGGNTTIDSIEIIS